MELKNEDWGFIQQPKFRCKVHGVITQTITIALEGRDEHEKINGNYCLICAAEEMLSRIGKVTPCND